jgi:hypothetical protein
MESEYIMSIFIVQSKKGTVEYNVPLGGSIFWYGNEADLPDGFSVVSAAGATFIRGTTAGSATDTPAGSNTHSHTNPASTESAGSHSHTCAPNVSGSSGGQDHYSVSNNNAAPTGHGHGAPSTSSATGGAHTHTLSATDTETVMPIYRRLYLIKASAETPVPIGGIILWNDTITNLNTEFEGTFDICDGGVYNGQSTPDMTDRFVYCASIDADVGNAGGSETHTHGNSDTGSGGSHSHSVSVNTYGCSVNQVASGEAQVNIADQHAHSLSATLSTDPAHTHTLGNTEAATSLPAYIMLYFAMRTL